MSKLVFDVRCKRNRNPYFVPLGGCLRTEIRLEEVKLKHLPGLLNSVSGSSIPGHRIEIDTKNRVGRIIDRMHLPENKEKDKQIRAALRADEMTVGKEFGNYNTEGCLPEEDHKFSDSVPGNLASWLFWCHRMHADGKLELIEGVLPDLDEIRRTGDVYGGPDNGLTPKEGKSIGSILEQTGKKTDKKEPAAMAGS